MMRAKRADGAVVSAVWRKRLAASLAVVVALVAAPALTLAVQGADGPQEAARRAGVDARAIVDPSDPAETLAAMERLAEPGECALPDAFEREAGLPRPCRDVRVDATGSIVSCMVDQSSDKAFQQVRAFLAERGWNEVSLGALEGATFVKEGGSCTWMLVTCSQVCDATNVVYRLA